MVTLKHRSREIQSYSPVEYVEAKYSVEIFKSHIESVLSEAMRHRVDKQTLDECVPQLAEDIIGNYDKTFLREICEGD